MTLLSLDRAWGGPGHLPLAGSLRVLLQVMSELRQMHEGQGEIHGELTPALVTLTDDSRVHLAAPPEPFSRSRPKGPYRLYYLAPEKLRGEAVGERADVFSVGVLLWEALAGRPMLELTALEDILARWRADVAPMAPVRDLHLWARSLSHIAARALAIEPTLRYANIRQFQNALETLAGRHAANLDAWEAILKGPPEPAPKATPAPRRTAVGAPASPRTQSDAELDQLPDFSHLTGDAPRVRAFQHNSDDTVFDITARPPDLELDDDMPLPEPASLDSYTALPDLASLLALPEEDELPTRFMAATPLPPSVAAPKPSPRTPLPALPPAPLPAPPPTLPRTSPAPARAVRPPITRSRNSESAPSPQASAKPPWHARSAWVLVVLLAIILGAISSQLAQPAKPTQAPTGAH